MRAVGWNMTDDLLANRSTDEALVSVVMPLYECEDYVAQAVESVLAQTYGNFELIVVDDCSTDRSAEVVEGIASRDVRVRLMRHEVNRGAGPSREAGLAHASGSYVAFFDADDTWFPEKLERQLAFMRERGAAMCFCSYETTRSNGSHYNYVHVPETLDYRGFLKNTVTCSHTIMFDLFQVDKAWLRYPGDRGFDYSEDAAVWLNVLKRGVVAHGLDEVLAQNRKHAGSRSSSKLQAFKRAHNLYRHIEGLSIAQTCWCHFWQIVHAIAKRIPN